MPVTARPIRQSVPRCRARAKPHRFARPGSLKLPLLEPAAAVSLMDELTRIVAHAAATILDLAAKADVRTKDVRTKADGSPVTAADEAAETVICEGLKRVAPGIAIVSEEHAARERPEVPTGKGASYFLVDPLDGTREFIAGRDEYTINIALVTDGEPVLGIICAPALGASWRGIIGRGADRASLSETSRPAKIHTRPRPAREAVIMVSRSHLEARTQAYVARFSAGQTGAMRILGQILPRRRRLGRSLSAARADARLGHRGGSRHCHSGRRCRHRARWIAAALWKRRSVDSGFRRIRRCSRRERAQ